MTALRHTVLPV